MLDHVSITVSDIAAAERFYDAIMKALGVVKVGRRDNWLGYGERARPAYPDRVYLTIRKGAKRRMRSAVTGAKGEVARSSTRSGTPALPPAAPVTAHRDCATITRPITARSCATPTGTGWRRSAITRCDQ